MEKCICFFFVYECSDREFDDFIFRISTMHELDATTFSIVCCHFFDITEIRKCVDIWVSYDDEVASAPSITSKRPTFGYTGFTSPRNDSISSVSCTKSDIYSIDEHFDNLF
jgi:hypothetical protein